MFCLSGLFTTAARTPVHMGDCKVKCNWINLGVNLAVSRIQHVMISCSYHFLIHLMQLKFSDTFDVESDYIYNTLCCEKLFVDYQINYFPNRRNRKFVDW